MSQIRHYPIAPKAVENSCENNRPKLRPILQTQKQPKLKQASAFVKTALGTFLAHYSERGLVALDFPGNKPAKRTIRAPTKLLSPQLRCWHRLTTRALQRALTGKPVFRLPPFDWSAATPFQRKVWCALQKIPPGVTTTYGLVAAAIGHPQAARAVGRACAANPIPILVPCHRVLPASKQLGGFAAGPRWKKLLLLREDVVFV